MQQLFRLDARGLDDWPPFLDLRLKVVNEAPSATWASQSPPDVITPPIEWRCVMLTLLAIAAAVLIAFGLFAWLQDHRVA
jgi:hypothetical protein